jgi:hypothetical protein
VANPLSFCSFPLPHQQQGVTGNGTYRVRHWQAVIVEILRSKYPYKLGSSPKLLPDPDLLFPRNVWA